jgi:hypothetical protein
MWDALPETRVTPRVWSQLRWQTGRSTWDSVILGALNTTEPANHRFQAQTYGLEAGLEKRWGMTPWIPRASFEFFRIHSTFKDLRRDLQSRGWASGWRLGAGVRGVWKASHAAVEAFLGSGNGWRLSLGRAF